MLPHCVHTIYDRLQPSRLKHSFSLSCCRFYPAFPHPRSPSLPILASGIMAAPSAASLLTFASSAPLPQSLNDPKASHYQLACFLRRAKCDEGLTLHLCGERGMESIADFAICYILDNHAATLAEEVHKAGLTCSPLQVSRLRSAWQLARAELPKAMGARSQAQSSTSSSGLGDPFHEESEAKRAKSFGEACDGFTFEADSMPLARIAGRIYRELS